MSVCARALPPGLAAIVAATFNASPLLAGVDDPFADEVIYFAGTNPASGYTNPLTAIGSPERFTGEGIFPGVVSPFSPAFGLDEIVSVGASGWIILKFDTPVTNDPNNLYGVDLLIFGNAGFIDVDYPNGIVGGVFSADGGLIEVSEDGQTWFPAPLTSADGLMPTQGYSDSGPYDAAPGKIETDFTRPVDPALELRDFIALDHPQAVALYRGSGGGAQVDLADVGLEQISYVRIYNPADAGNNFEIDAVSDVSPRLPGDVDLNGVVNIDDMFAVIGAWGSPVPGGPPADFDLNGIIDIDDLFVVITNWTG